LLVPCIYVVDTDQPQRTQTPLFPASTKEDCEDKGYGSRLWALMRRLVGPITREDGPRKKRGILRVERPDTMPSQNPVEIYEPGRCCSDFRSKGLCWRMGGS
jgi:hypothetical protein